MSNTNAVPVLAGGAAAGRSPALAVVRDATGVVAVVIGGPRGGGVACELSATAPVSGAAPQAAAANATVRTASIRCIYEE